MAARLFRSTVVVGAMTLLSRVSGLVRDVAFAHFLGSGLFADAFFVAFRVPNFLRRIFGEGALSVAFVPVYTELRSVGTAPQARSFLELVAGRLGLVLIVLTLAGVAAAPVIVTIMAPGFVLDGDAQKYQATVDALRIAFPYLFFISLVALAGGVLNTCGRFAVPALTPVLLNLCLIGAAVALVPMMGNAAVALAIGVFVAGAVQLGFQLPFLAREGQLPRPRLRRRAGDDDDRVGDESVGRMLRLMIPALFGTSVAQVNLLINTILASFLVTGSISWLYYADRLMEFPLGVFGIALGTAILPSLSEQHATRSRESFAATLDWALHWVALIAPAAALALAVLAGPLMVTLFQYGRFGPGDAVMAGQALVAFAVGLPAFVLVKVLAPGFYARQDTRTPVRAAVIAMIVNAVASVLLVFPLAHAGLALATSIAGFVNALVLYRILGRESVLQPGPGWPGFLARVALACTAMVAVLWYGSGDIADWISLGLGARVGRLLLCVVAGAMVYGATIVLLRIDLRQLVHRNPANTGNDSSGA